MAKMETSKFGHDDEARAGSSRLPMRHGSSTHDPHDQNGVTRNHLTNRRPEAYSVAWICALHIEMAAARAMLDEVHEPLPTRTGDTNTYVLGRIKQHNVVITCLPEAQYGTNSATNVVTNMQRTFPSIRAGLMVGIGGGVPTKADVRLGDIVVGIRVMQHDMGKLNGEGQLQRTGIPRLPGQLLRTTVTALRAKHELQPSQVSSIIRERLGGYTGYSRPSAPSSLYRATYDHVDSSSPNCDQCDPSKLESLSQRISSDPLIHYGAIASGNQVVRSGKDRDAIARDLDVICFEMETAGLMDVLPCLPIRGICDYSDSHKNKQWQKYASAAAAAYAVELLEVLPTLEAAAKASQVSPAGKSSPELCDYLSLTTASPCSYGPKYCQASTALT